MNTIGPSSNEAVIRRKALDSFQRILESGEKKGAKIGEEDLDKLVEETPDQNIQNIIYFSRNLAKAPSVSPLGKSLLYRNALRAIAGAADGTAGGLAAIAIKTLEDAEKVDEKKEYEAGRDAYRIGESALEIFQKAGGSIEAIGRVSNLLGEVFYEDNRHYGRGAGMRRLGLKAEKALLDRNMKDFARIGGEMMESALILNFSTAKDFEKDIASLMIKIAKKESRGSDFGKIAEMADRMGEKCSSIVLDRTILHSAGTKCWKRGLKAIDEDGKGELKDLCLLALEIVRDLKAQNKEAAILGGAGALESLGSMSSNAEKLREKIRNDLADIMRLPDENKKIEGIEKALEDLPEFFEREYMDEIISMKDALGLAGESKIVMEDEWIMVGGTRLPVNKMEKEVGKTLANCVNYLDLVLKQRAKGDENQIAP